MIEFKKYSKIANVTTECVNRIYTLGHHQQVWNVLLKLHGACFSLYVDGDNIIPARKRNFIDSDDGAFYNYKQVIGSIEHEIKMAYETLYNKYGHKNVIFYGELAGGKYPHKDVTRNNTSKKIGHGVYYAPFNFYYIFDIKVNGVYLDHSEVVDICNAASLIVAEPLFKGSLDECLKYPNTFEDPMYQYFGLPKIDNNMCEGVVIKPETACYFGNGSRCILKNKNPKFSEISKGKGKTRKPPTPLSEKHQATLDILVTYVNENRLHNVLSHGIVVDQDGFGILIKELNKDVWIDFIEDNETMFNSLEKHEQKMVKRSLNSMSANVIRPLFQKIVDGEL